MNTSRLRRSIPAVVLCSVLLGGCHSAQRSEPIAGPFKLNDAHLEKGRQLFDTHCYKCHGEGDGALAPAINDKSLPRFLMRFQIRHGLGAMPAFTEDQLSQAEVDSIVDYVVALRHHGK